MFRTYGLNTAFPIPVKYLSEKLYTNIKYADIPLGSEIIAVNGIKVEDFIKDVSKYTTTDGFNKTGKFAFLETNYFPFYVYLAYGEQEFFEIEYKFKDKTEKKKLEAISFLEFYKVFSKRFVPEYEQKEESYSFDYLDENTGLLTVHTFDIGGAESTDHKKYAQFLTTVFKDLKEKNIENLIVDIRDNGGGNDPNDILLYSYLTKRNFKENTEAFVNFHEELPMKEYYSIQNIEAIKKLEKELQKTFSVEKNNKYYLNSEFNPEWKPDENAFQGSIYLLIDPFVASAGSLFASMVKSDEEAVIIGQETLGGYYGHTGHISVSYVLPNSGFIVGFSIVDLKQDVKKLSDQKIGEGVKPNHFIEISIEDYLKSKDVVIEFTKELIRSK